MIRRIRVWLALSVLAFVLATPMSVRACPS
jgi:hypothetical protein